MNSDFSIVNDLDPGRRSDGAEYLTYLADVRGGAVGDMGFTLEDFKTIHCWAVANSPGASRSCLFCVALIWVSSAVPIADHAG